MVDSGDAFQGLPVSNNSKGEEMAKAMNSVGYDAMTVGNHEFDFGYDQLLKLQKQLNFLLFLLISTKMVNVYLILQLQ